MSDKIDLEKLDKELDEHKTNRIADNIKAIFGETKSGREFIRKMEQGAKLKQNLAKIKNL